MNTVVVGAQGCVGDMLVRRAEKRGHEIVVIDNVHLQRGQLADMLPRDGVWQVIVAIHLDAYYEHSLIDGALTEGFDELLSLCSERGFAVFHLSSTDVIAVDHQEFDDNRETGVATFLHDAESRLMASACRGVVLRVANKFSPFATFYQQLVAEGGVGVPMSVNASQLCSVTPISDVARVAIAMVEQGGYGAYPGSIYHYASAGLVSHYEFLSAALVALEQTPGNITVPQLIRDEADLCDVSAALVCQRILCDYGIRQRSWRSGLNSDIQEYFSR